MTYYLWRLRMCLGRGRITVGIAAPARAKKELLCQEMHHYITAHVQSPRDGDLPGNQTKCWGLFTGQPASVTPYSTSLPLLSVSAKSGLWEGTPQQISWTPPFDSEFALWAETLQGSGGGRPSLSTQAPPSRAVGEDLVHKPFLLQYPKSGCAYRKSCLSVLSLTHWAKFLKHCELHRAWLGSVSFTPVSPIPSTVPDIHLYHINTCKYWMKERNNEQMDAVPTHQHGGPWRKNYGGTGPEKQPDEVVLWKDSRMTPVLPKSK